mgnify:CR=1
MNALTPIDRYQLEIERDEAKAQREWSLSASAMRKGERKAAKSHKESAEAWERHAARHAAILAKMLTEETRA